MFELSYDFNPIYADDPYRYYDIYYNNEPILKNKDNTYCPLCLSIMEAEKRIEIINASKDIYFELHDIKHELYDLIVSLIDELDIHDYSIYMLEEPYSYNEIMTSELAYELANKTDFNVIYL